MIVFITMRSGSATCSRARAFESGPEVPHCDSGAAEEGGSFLVSAEGMLACVHECSALAPNLLTKGSAKNGFRDRPLSNRAWRHLRGFKMDHDEEIRKVNGLGVRPLPNL